MPADDGGSEDDAGAASGGDDDSEGSSPASSAPTPRKGSKPLSRMGMKALGNANQSDPKRQKGKQSSGTAAAQHSERMEAAAAIKEESARLVAVSERRQRIQDLKDLLAMTDKENEPEEHAELQQELKDVLRGKVAAAVAAPASVAAASAGTPLQIAAVYCIAGAMQPLNS